MGTICEVLLSTELVLDFLSDFKIVCVAATAAAAPKQNAAECVAHLEIGIVCATDYLKRIPMGFHACVSDFGLLGCFPTYTERKKFANGGRGLSVLLFISGRIKAHQNGTL